MNSLPLPRPLTARLNRAAMKFHELARQRQPDAHACARVHVVGMNLREQLEDLCELPRRNADTRIVDPNDTFAAFRRNGQ